MKNTVLECNTKKRWTLLLAVSIFICLYSVYLCFVVDPFVDNLTGLGYVHHHFFLMLSYTLLISFDSIFLSNLLFKKYSFPNAKRYQIGLIGGWVLMCIGVLIPWQEKTSSAQLDLHSLLCTISSIFMSGLWLRLYTNPFSYGKFKTIIFFELLAILCGILWIAFCGSISLMSEISYVCLNIIVLTFAQYPTNHQ